MLFIFHKVEVSDVYLKTKIIYQFRKYDFDTTLDDSTV